MSVSADAGLRARHLLPATKEKIGIGHVQKGQELGLKFGSSNWHASQIVHSIRQATGVRRSRERGAKAEPETRVLKLTRMKL